MHFYNLLMHLHVKINQIKYCTLFHNSDFYSTVVIQILYLLWNCWLDSSNVYTYEKTT